MQKSYESTERSLSTTDPTFRSFDHYFEGKPAEHLYFAEDCLVKAFEGDFELRFGTISSQEWGGWQRDAATMASILKAYTSLNASQLARNQSEAMLTRILSEPEETQNRMPTRLRNILTRCESSLRSQRKPGQHSVILRRGPTPGEMQEAMALLSEELLTAWNQFRQDFRKRMGNAKMPRALPQDFGGDELGNAFDAFAEDLYRASRLSDRNPTAQSPCANPREVTNALRQRIMLYRRSTKNLLGLTMRFLVRISHFHSLTRPAIVARIPSTSVTRLSEGINIVLLYMCPVQKSMSRDVEANYRFLPGGGASIGMPELIPAPNSPPAPSEPAGAFLPSRPGILILNV